MKLLQKLEHGSEQYMNIEILGDLIETEKDFHKQIATSLEVEEYYGCNLDALWDLLSVGIERPITLIWKNSTISKIKLGDNFDKIIEVLEKVKKQDEAYGWEDKFIYIMN